MTIKRLGFFPVKDMQTPPPPPALLCSGHIYVKDTHCAETNKKAIYFIFIFGLIFIFLDFIVDSVYNFW